MPTNIFYKSLYSSITTLANNCSKLTLFGYKFDKCSSELKFEDILSFVVYLGSNLIGLAGFVAVIFIIYGGIMYIYAGGNPEQTKKASTTLTYAIVGFVIALTAYIIVNTFLQQLVGKQLTELNR
ncbi:pilin [Patescibacteria group bacterium]|nr:pilin [Patescibacteria group bacterium]